MKKAQAAMEFIMTYGWAILVVLMAIGALAYFGVLSPARFLPETCTFPAGTDCVDKATIISGADGTNYIEFALRNNIGFSINITGFTDNDAEDSCTTDIIRACAGAGCTLSDVQGGSSDAPVMIDHNQMAIIRMACSNTIPTGRFSYNPTVTYKNMDTRLDHPAVGSIRGVAS